MATGHTGQGRGAWQTLGGLCLALVSLCGCGEEPPAMATVAEQLRAGSEAGVGQPDRRVLRRAETGPVLVVFCGPPEGSKRTFSPLAEMAASAAKAHRCSVALFDSDGERGAADWVVAELQRAPADALQRPIGVIGYGYGGAAAAQVVQQLIHRHQEQVHLLVTVDAVKKGTLQVVTSTTASLFTLDQPVPGYRRSFLAHTRVPAVDGETLLRHVNYYQTTSALVRGGPIPSASENHAITRRWDQTLRHSTVDDYAAGFIAADVALLFAGEQ